MNFPRIRPRRKAHRSSSAFAFRPSVDAVEQRLLLTTGFLQGTAFLDNGAHVFEPGEGLPGATITATPTFSGGTTESTNSGSDGSWLLSNLVPGNYTITETPPTGYTNSAVQSLDPLNPSSGQTTSSINVTVVDPTQLGVSYPSFSGLPSPGYQIEPINYTLYGVAHADYVGTYDITVQQTLPNLSTSSQVLPAYCVNIGRSIVPGGVNLPYASQPLESGLQALSQDGSSPDSQVQYQNAGKIAYLDNTFASTALTPQSAAGLQLAIWELEYNATPSSTNPFTTGNLLVDASTDATTISDAEVYLNDAESLPANSNVQAIYLNGLPTGLGGAQGLVVAGSLNFGNAPNSVSINGFDYLVSNTTTPGSLTTSTTGNPISGTTVTLSGTDEFGNSVTGSTTTNSSGFYSFTGLNPSNASGYTVTETPPTSDSHLGQTSTTAVAITNTPPGTPSVVSNIVLTTVNSSSTDNFFETQTVSVNGTDYLVSNTTAASSLTASTTGTPISGTTVTLTGTDAFGNAVNKTTTTNASGQYSFPGLNPSNGSGYTVTETPPASDTHLGQTSTTSGTVTTPATTPVVSTIVLTTNGASSTDNYFEVRPSCPRNVNAASLHPASLHPASLHPASLHPASDFTAAFLHVASDAAASLHSAFLHSGIELAASLRHSGIELAASLRHSGIELAASLRHSGIELAASLRHSGIELAASLRHSGIELAASLRHSGIELAASLRHSGFVFAASLRHSGIELAASLRHSGIELAASLRYSGFELAV